MLYYCTLLSEIREEKTSEPVRHTCIYGIRTKENEAALALGRNPLRLLVRSRPGDGRNVVRFLGLLTPCTSSYVQSGPKKC
jgi:hypothetical protein